MHVKNAPMGCFTQEKMLKTQAWEQGVFGWVFIKKFFALGFSFCYKLNKNGGVFLAILQILQNFQMKNPPGIWPFPRPGFFKMRTRFGFGNFLGTCFYSSENENWLSKKQTQNPPLYTGHFNGLGFLKSVPKIAKSQAWFFKSEDSIGIWQFSRPVF